MAFSFTALGVLADGLIEALAVEQAEGRATWAVLVTHAETTTVTVTCVSGHKVACLQQEAEGTHLVCGSGIYLQGLPGKSDLNKRLLPQTQPAATAEP